MDGDITLARSGRGCVSATSLSARVSASYFSRPVRTTASLTPSHGSSGLHFGGQNCCLGGPRMIGREALINNIGDAICLA
jgi:hypothetical protein